MSAYALGAWAQDDPRLVRLSGYRPATHADRWEGHREVCYDMVMRTPEVDAVRDRELLDSLHVIFSDYGGYGMAAAAAIVDAEQPAMGVGDGPAPADDAVDDGADDRADDRVAEPADDPDPAPAAAGYVPHAWPPDDPRLMRLVGYRPAKYADRWEGHRDICCDLVMRTAEDDAVRDRELLAALHVIFSDSEERALSTDPVDVLSSERIEECVVRCWRSPAARATNRTRLLKAAAALAAASPATAPVSDESPPDDGSSSGESGDLEPA